MCNVEFSNCLQCIHVFTCMIPGSSAMATQSCLLLPAGTLSSQISEAVGPISAAETKARGVFLDELLGAMLEHHSLE